MASYIDKGYPVDVIYLDFSKTFDTVLHGGLISKLTAHGIAGKTNIWIERQKTKSVPKWSKTDKNVSVVYHRDQYSAQCYLSCL